MGHIHEELKLPKAKKLEMVKSVKITMSNDETYVVKVDDLVAIQFIRNDQRILVRRGRIKDLVVVNEKQLSTKTDNVSRIILDCSEQFTVKILEIKFSEVIKIGTIDAEFEDYSDRIEHLPPNFMEENKCPVREHGLITKEEVCDRICKSPKPEPKPGAVAPRGFAIMK